VASVLQLTLTQPEMAEEPIAPVLVGPDSR